MKKGQTPPNTKINLLKVIKAKKLSIVFFIILFLSSFLRFYNIETLSPFGWDQVDNAWASVKILINHDYPLVGMQAKGNSGVFIGPLYYYLIALVYSFTNLDPIASGIFAGLTSIFSLVALYFVTKKILNEKIALIAVFINAFTVSAILYDRAQWPVNFIPAISLLIFYYLFEIVRGNAKYILALSAVVGFSFHIHFTSIFYPIIVLLVLPLFPRKKETLKYLFFGFLIFSIFIFPIIINFLSNINSAGKVSSYGNSYYHGLHLRRVMQLIGDAFIQFDFFLKYDFLKPLKFVLLPLFIIAYIYKKPSKEKYLLGYLIALFFLIPWVVMSTYSGELSDYYFSTSRFLVIFIIAYFLYQIYSLKYKLAKFIVLVAILIYGFLNISEFFHQNTGNTLKSFREKAISAVNSNQKIEFKEGVPESYFYYYYMYKKGVKAY